jgi:hypothetical protein
MLWSRTYEHSLRKPSILTISSQNKNPAVSGGVSHQILPMPSQLYNLPTRKARRTAIWVTGSNIAIVVAMLMLVGTRILGKRRAVGLTLAGIALYTLLVGADATVVRAAEGWPR